MGLHNLEKEGKHVLPKKKKKPYTNGICEDNLID
jgi:hypothetical protein